MVFIAAEIVAWLKEIRAHAPNQEDERGNLRMVRKDLENELEMEMIDDKYKEEKCYDKDTRGWGMRKMRRMQGDLDEKDEEAKSWEKDYRNLRDNVEKDKKNEK
jgi:hypothetical protein